MNRVGSFIVDFLATSSIFGIWPRFIEPRLVKKTYLNLKINSPFKSLKIIQITDLHFHKKIPSFFLNKIIRKIQEEKADLIVLTGDFFCYAKCDDKQRLKTFLKALKAPMGSFCTFGNHDYAVYVSRDKEGNYTTLKPINPLLGLLRGFKFFFQKGKDRKGMVSETAATTGLNEELIALLRETPFQPLENTTTQLNVGLNLVGLGDYALGRCHPEVAFKNYNPDLPGIVLSHNPDTFPQLLNYPGEVVLSGHTHGEQIHFPFPKALRKLSQRLARLENPEYTRGLYNRGKKTLYVNRGLGGHKPFRLFSPPEILVLTLNNDERKN